MVADISKWEDLRAKPVAILGDGVSGTGVKKLLDRLHWKSKIFDEKGIPLSYSKLKNSSIVVVSPGFSPDHPWIQLVREMNLLLLSEMDFAAYFLPDSPLAITGTNGKTTLSSLIAHVYNKLGEKNVLAGNMGYSLSEYLSGSIGLNEKVILEISSFQSWDLSILKPKASIWTNFEDDHLDYHKSRENYFDAKLRLLERTDGPVWVGESVSDWANRLNRVLPSGHTMVKRVEQNEFPLSENHFLSSFPQRENYALAEAFFNSIGISARAFATLAEDYVPKEHRLSETAKIRDVRFWNDSKATNFSATLAACKSMRGRTIWIGGGKSKGVGFEKFAGSARKYLDEAYVFGEVAGDLVESFSTNGIRVRACQDLREAVRRAYDASTDKTNILFSPGFSSFDQFENFEERGEFFERIVLDLKSHAFKSTQLELN